MAFCCCTGKNMTKGVADRVDPLEELRRHGLTRSPAPQLQHEETAVPVSINVYSLTPRNRRLRKIGFGIFHTGVVVYGIEWGYGEAVHNPNASGLFYVRPGEAEGSLYKHIRVGYTTKSPAQVDTILHRLENEWRSSEYHILHHNCNHFAQAFCDALSSRERLIIPSWCNRAARISDKVLPQKLATKVQRMLDGLPPTASVPSEQNNDHNKNSNAEWRQHVSGIPVSVVPKYWYLHPSVRQPPRYITKPTPTPLTVSELVHSTSTPLPTPLSAFEKESPAFAHQIRNNTINDNDESSNINYNNHVLRSNGIGGSSMAAIQHLQELHVTESNVPAPGQSDSFIVPSSNTNTNINTNTNTRVAPETITFTSSSSASLAPVHHIPLPPPPPPPPSLSHSRKIITPPERLSLISTEHNEERNILEKMSSVNSPRRLPPISPLLSVNTRTKGEDEHELTHSNDKHVDVNKMDVEEELNDTQWESAADNNDEDNMANQESEGAQDVNEENNLYSSVSASSQISNSSNNRRSSSYREELVSSSAGEELPRNEKMLRQTLHDENKIMTVEMDESVKSTSVKDIYHENDQLKNEIDIDKSNNDNKIEVKHTVIPVSSWLKQIHEQEEEEEEINSELLVEEKEMEEEEEKEFYSLEEEEEELPEEEPQMSRLSHRSSVMTTNSLRVSPSRSPTRIAYTTTMRSFISNNNNMTNNSIDNSNRYNSYTNNKSTIANSAPPALSLEDDDVQKEKEEKGKIKIHEGRSDNNSMFDITQRELNAMFDGVSSNHEGKWHNEELELLSSVQPSSLSCRVREYALQQRRHVRAESKPEMTRYNTFMVEKEPISPTLPVSLHKEQIRSPSETVKAIRDIHIDSDDVANHNNIMSASQNSEKVCTAVPLVEHKESKAIHHVEENESHTLPMKFAASVLAKQSNANIHKNNHANVHNSTEDEKEAFVKSEMRSSLHDSRTAYSKRPCYSQDDSLLNVNTVSSTTLLEPTLRRSLSEGNLLEKHTSTSTNKEEYELYQPISNNVLESENTDESESVNNMQVCKEDESNTYNDNNTSSNKSKTCNECSTTNTNDDDNAANDNDTSEHVDKSAESQDGDLYCHPNLRNSNNSDYNEGKVKHHSWNLSDHDEIELYSPIEYNSSHEKEKAKSHERLSSANKKNCRSYSYSNTKFNSEESDHESSSGAMRREKTTLLISPEPDWEVQDMERERTTEKFH